MQGSTAIWERALTRSTLAPAGRRWENGSWRVNLNFYGSSITQGGCASRSSNSYCALVSRWLDSDFYCLGFSGGAMGEPWMAEYISQLPMSCFVYDYDHNAPSPDYLRQTHRPFLQTILDKNPALPVIAMSRPYPNLPGTDSERREMIYLPIVLSYAVCIVSMYS